MGVAGALPHTAGKQPAKGRGQPIRVRGPSVSGWDAGAAARRAVVDAEVAVAPPEPIVEEVVVEEQPVDEEAAVVERRPTMELSSNCRGAVLWRSH
ncbi:hypothetical protein Q1695_012751 [Nippostrongylus brasiliensis]|nr:hypothetical protein Q1695_012751 [Nippostrongylus brasiliensis]